MYVVPLGYKLLAAGGHEARNTNAENIMVFCIARAALRVCQRLCKAYYCCLLVLRSCQASRLNGYVVEYLG